MWKCVAQTIWTDLPKTAINVQMCRRDTRIQYKESRLMAYIQALCSLPISWVLIACSVLHKKAVCWFI